MLLGEEASWARLQSEIDDDSSSTQADVCSLCGFHGDQALQCRYCRTSRCQWCYERGERCLCYNEGTLYFPSQIISFHSEESTTPPLPGTPTPADEPQPSSDFLGPPPLDADTDTDSEVPEMLLGEEASWALVPLLWEEEAAGGCIPPKPTRPTPR